MFSDKAIFQFKHCILLFCTQIHWSSLLHYFHTVTCTLYLNKHIYRKSVLVMFVSGWVVYVGIVGMFN